MLAIVNRFWGKVGGRRVIVALGALFVTLGGIWGPLEVRQGTPVSTAFILSVFTIVPGLILLYEGYRLPRLHVNADFHPAIVNRSLAGLGVILGVIAIYHFQPAGGTSNPFRAAIILGSFGTVAGYRVGIHNARAEELRRTREQLRDTIDQLETSNELLEQFAYAASHDLQEPLRMISSHLLLIDRRAGDTLDEDCKEYLDFAVERANRMREMTDGLLEYSRIETADDPLEPLDLYEVVEDVLSDLELQIDENEAEITVEELPQVEGDSSQLQQLFQNLIRNAIKYSGEELAQVVVFGERNGAICTVSVRDEGIGIHPDEADRIFDVFERLHTTETHNGIGMGLTLCKRIVERHGGDISVDSTPGEGSTFSVTLPAAEVHADE